MAHPASDVSLSRLHVQRYRSLRDATFEPNSGLSVLVGPNGVGKTNVLNSILLLRGSLRRIYAYDDPGEFVAGVSVEAAYALGAEELTFRPCAWRSKVPASRHWGAILSSSHTFADSFDIPTGKGANWVEIVGFD